METDLFAFVAMLVQQEQRIEHRMPKASAEDLVAFQEDDGFVIFL